ncbi:hypothetical protein APHAL10511_007493 [Amanita phalloides]|nr:hypothetical protein APHAL10511_007493 [Amanita phalloides]
MVEINNSQHWEHGIPALERQLNRQTDAALSGTAPSKVYWIGAIGPHWKHSEKLDDGQDVRALIDWHDTAHDHAFLTTSKPCRILLQLYYLQPALDSMLTMIQGFTSSLSSITPNIRIMKSGSLSGWEKPFVRLNA